MRSSVLIALVALIGVCSAALTTINVGSRGVGRFYDFLFCV